MLVGMMVPVWKRLLKGLQGCVPRSSRHCDTNRAATGSPVAALSVCDVDSLFDNEFYHFGACGTLDVGNITSVPVALLTLAK